MPNLRGGGHLAAPLLSEVSQSGRDFLRTGLEKKGLGQLLAPLLVLSVSEEDGQVAAWDGRDLLPPREPDTILLLLLWMGLCL